MRTTLESGAWVEHVPIQELKGKHKRLLGRVNRMSMPQGVVDDDGKVNVDALMSGIDMFEYGAAKQDALWAVLIDKWSYDLPVPEVAGGEVENAQAFDEIPLGDYEEITALFAPFAARLDRRPDPKGSTTSASNGSSPARAGGSPTG